MKKGFTLIELLAVIVVLAIIALILTPLITNIEEKAKREVAKRSVENYISAANNASAISLINHERGIAIESENYIFESGINNDELSKIHVSGNYPKYVYIEYDLKSIKVKSGKFCMDKYNFNYENGKVIETGVDYCKGAKGYDASELGYTNELSKDNCETVECALNELYREVNE